MILARCSGIFPVWSVTSFASCVGGQGAPGIHAPFAWNSGYQQIANDVGNFVEDGDSAISPGTMHRHRRYQHLFFDRRYSRRNFPISLVLERRVPNIR
jgi:hypothetical protein